MKRDRTFPHCRPSFRKPAWSMVAGLSLALCSVSVRAAIPNSERQALLDLYQSTNGAHWKNSSGWNGAPGTECTWYGITCNGAGTHVVEIALPRNKLLGSLPLSLQRLGWLASFDVSNNGFPGGALVGKIPPLSGFRNLRRFLAPNNTLSGDVPALPSSMVRFDVHRNVLDGVITPFGNLPNLAYFDVSGNTSLKGSIPSLSGLPKLQYFDVSLNMLSGQLPSLTGLTHLKHFGANSFFGDNPNRFTGPLPSLSGLANLQSFEASANALTGAIPSLAGLSNLMNFDVQSNALSGSIPSVAGLSRLTTFIVSDNQLSGQIPPFAGQTNLQTYSAANNELSGSLPSLDAMPNIETLLIDHNQLSGQIPSFANLHLLTGVDLSYNQFTGPPPVAPTPNELIDGGSTLCPNFLTPVPDPIWDAATGNTPWYQGCTAPSDRH